MIKLKNLCKQYNKGKPNCNIVLKNISFELDSTGLISILGKSGCGKTTLLNIIGGIDFFDSGELVIDGLDFSEYRAKYWDSFRNENIGYIFQNFCLFEEKTIYENIEIGLKLSYVMSNNQLNKRIDYILDKVGLLRQKNKLAAQLSGGQKQRLAIARAISKNSRILIADEPTGNLDDSATHNIMNILKKLSLERLVILVTHEEDIARLYSDRIIELDNGTILRDYSICSNTSYINYINEDYIYLNDFSLHTNTTNNSIVNINHYKSSNKEANCINIDLVYKNGIMYIKSDDDPANIIYITKDSNVKIIDDKYDMSNKKSYLINQIDSNIYENKTKSFFKCKDTIKLFFSEYIINNKISNISILIYILSGILIAYIVGSFGGIYYVNDDFVDLPYNYITVVQHQDEGNDSKSLSNEDIFMLKSDNIIDGVDFGKSAVYFSEFQYMQNSIYKDFGISLEYYPVVSNASLLSESDLIYGKLPIEQNEIVISKSLLDEILVNMYFHVVDSYEDIEYLNMYFSYKGIPIDYENLDFNIDFKIVGITDENFSVVYGSEYLIVSHNNTEILPIDYYIDSINITYGEIPSNIGEVVVPYNSIYINEAGLLKSDAVTYSGEKIVGLFVFDFASDKFNSKFDYTEMKLGTYEFIYMSSQPTNFENDNSNYINVYSNSATPKNLENNLNSRGYEAYHNYSYLKTYYMDKKIEQSHDKMIYLGVLGIVIVFILIFIGRSNLLVKFKNFGLYRVLGVSKKDIYKYIFIESIFVTSIFVFVGFTGGLLALSEIQSNLYNKIVFNFRFSFFIVGIVFMYLVNILVTLIPVLLYLRKTPSYLNSKFEL